MFCQNCGAQLPDGAKVCTNCGTQIAAPQQSQQPVYQQPQQPVYQQPVYQQPVYQQPGATSVTPKSVLVFGILGIAFAFSFYLGILGIIFSAIAMKKAKTYLAEGGIPCGQVKTGKILGTIGLIAGIVMSVIFVIYLVVMIFALTAYNSYGYYDFVY